MKKVTHFTSLEKPWGKSHTPLRYIHPPFAEEIVTMWPNMTVMLGEIQGGAYPQKTVTGRITESALPSAAMAFLVRDKLFKSENAEYKNAWRRYTDSHMRTEFGCVYFGSGKFLQYGTGTDCVYKINCAQQYKK